MFVLDNISLLEIVQGIYTKDVVVTMIKVLLVFVVGALTLTTYDLLDDLVILKSISVALNLSFSVIFLQIDISTYVGLLYALPIFLGLPVLILGLAYLGTLKRGY